LNALKDLNYVISFKAKGANPLTKFTVNLSYNAVKSAKKAIVIKGEGLTLELSPSKLESLFKGVSSSRQNDATVSITVEKASKQQQEQLLKFKEKDKQLVSDIFRISVLLQVGKQKNEINNLSGKLDITVISGLAINLQNKTLGMYKYEPITRKWTAVSQGYYPGIYIMPNTYMDFSGWYAVFAK